MTRRWSTRIFRALLALYPGEFRDEYGREVAMVFADRYRDATGALDRACIWLEAIAGVLREAPKEHAHMMLQDLRYAARTMRRNPGFTATAVLTLALGIGANAAVFSVINTLLLKPLAVEDPHNLYVLTSVHQDNEKPHQLSWLDYRDYRDRAHVLTDLAAYVISFASLNADERADRIAVNYVTGNYFSMLGVAPAHGRLILPSEGETPGADPIVVLGHRYWQRRFNGDPSIVGRRVLVNARPVTVVGVAPASFTGVVALVDFDAYLPFGMMSAASTSTFREITTDRASHQLNVIGRLAPRVTSGQAQAALDVLARQLERQYPDTNTSVRTRLIPEPLARPEPGDANSKPLVAGVFLLLVGLVLLVACVNVVSLLMVRATARHRELAVRAALGAARLRLVRQLLTESLLLAALGGAAGAAIGWWGTRILARVPFPADIPVRFELAFDWRVFVYISAIALGTGIVVGLLPALRASRADVNDAMREGGRGASDGRARQRLRGALVVMQVAVSVVLLVAAGLFVRSVQRAQSVDLGFDPRHILNLSVDVSQQGYDEARGRAFFKELESRVSRLPGVQSVTFASSVPLGFSGTSTSIEVEGQAVRKDQRRPSIGYNAVGASYFETMRVPVLRGRSFTTRDDARAQPVAIVNEHMAATLWPGQNPVGKRFRVSGENEPWLEVAGVSKQGKYGFLFENPRPHFHVPIEQRYRPMRTLQIRSVGAPDALAPIVQKTIRELDPNLPIYDVRSMTQALDGGGGFFLPRMAALFGVGLGLLGLVLALVGIYGVVSYAAALRTQEIGVRIALGAGSRDILRLVVGHGLTLVAMGIALGVSVALGVSRLIGGLLFGISPTDPATFIAVPLALAAAAFTASCIPAWRAARINPLVALQDRRS